MTAITDSLPATVKMVGSRRIADRIGPFFDLMTKHPQAKVKALKPNALQGFLFRFDSQGSLRYKNVVSDKHSLSYVQYMYSTCTVYVRF
jgi:hypothetical protein